MFDEYQLSTTSSGVFPSSPDPKMNDEMTFYAMQFMNSTKFVGHPAVESNRNLFSAACYTHCSTESSNYHSITIKGSNLDQAISQWFFQDTSFHLYDTCNSWKCGTGCP